MLRASSMRSVAKARASVFLCSFAVPALLAVATWLVVGRFYCFDSENSEAMFATGLFAALTILLGGWSLLRYVPVAGERPPMIEVLLIASVLGVLLAIAVPNLLNGL